jgi:hypothetical protein
MNRELVIDERISGLTLDDIRMYVRATFRFEGMITITRLRFNAPLDRGAVPSEGQQRPRIPIVIGPLDIARMERLQR